MDARGVEPPVDSSEAPATDPHVDPTGIEPASVPAPRPYHFVVEVRGIEPPVSRSRTARDTTSLHLELFVAPDGIEPSPYRI